MIEQVRGARALKPEEVRGNVGLKAEPPQRKDRAAGVAARDQAKVPAGVKAKAEAVDKAVVGGLR